MPALRSELPYRPSGGPKALENIVDLDLSFDVEPEKSMLRRRALAAADDGDDTDARLVTLSF